MKRRLFNAASLVSLLLCIATLPPWILSHFREYSASQCIYLPVMPNISTATFHPLATQRYTLVEVNAGRLLLAQSYRTIDMVLPSWGWKGNTRPVVDPGHLPFWTREVAPPSDTFSRIILPIWFFTAAFAMLPLAWKFSSRAPAAGRCTHCGYDLRATPDRCPECGNVPEKSVISKEPIGH